MAYKIRVDGVTISNSKISESVVDSPIVTLETNKTGSFTFTLPQGHAYYDKIQRRKSSVVVIRDGEELFSGICVSEKIDMFKQKKITCEGELTFLNDSIQRQARYQNQTVYSLLNAYLQSHNSQVEAAKAFTIGQVTVEGGDTIYRYTNMNTTMKEISEDLIDNYGGYLRVRHQNNVRYLDYLAASPRLNNQVIELGKNLINYDSNIDNTDIATVIIPLGAKQDEQVIEGLEKRLDIKSVNSGLDYIEASQDILDRYGRICKVVIWDDVTVPSILKSKAQEYLNNVQFEDVQVTCTAIDMGVFSPDVDDFRLLDTIRIISEPHGMNKLFMLNKVKYNLNEPEKDTFTFSKTEKYSLAAKNNSANRTIQKQLDEIPTRNSILEEAQEQASALIAGADGGYVVIEPDNNGHPSRILIMDSPDKTQAVNVIQINKNGIGFSNNGINGTYRNAWTISGNLVADFITSGKITGIELNNGNGTFRVKSNGDVTASAITASGLVVNNNNGVFQLSANGDLKATSAQLTGKVSATTFDINGSTIADSNEQWSDTSLSWDNTQHHIRTASSLITVPVFKFDANKGMYFSKACYLYSLNTPTLYAYKSQGNSAYFNNLYVETGNMHTLYVNGNAITGSDRDIKHDIEKIDIKKSLAFINGLKPVEYVYNDGNSGRKHHGFIAQDVKKAMGKDDWGVYVDRGLTDEENKTKGLRYEEIIADLVNVVKDLVRRVEELGG